MPGAYCHQHVVEGDGSLDRRTLNLGLLSLAAMPMLPAVAGAQQKPIDVSSAMAPRVIGKPDAPVEIVEYFSLTCPHCARFHATTYKDLVDGPIADGTAKMELRDFPLDQWALRAAAMARCTTGKRYFAMIDILLERQGTWTRGNILGELKKIGQLAGLSGARVEQCMTDEPLLNAILAQRLEGSKTHEVNSTPSFLVNGAKVAGALSTSEFIDLINDAA